MLERLITSIFGVSALTVRTPALIGAAIYIYSCYAFSRFIGSSQVQRWTALVCLVYNPFVFDYLVAARGYSLALGFLMLLILTGTQASDRSILRTCVICSICSALSFAASFSFAFVNLTALGFVSIRRRRAILALTLPGILVSIVLVSSVLLNWPKGHLFHGATTLLETCCRRERCRIR